jgi:hypothetical protein
MRIGFSGYCAMAIGLKTDRAKAPAKTDLIKRM